MTTLRFDPRLNLVVLNFLIMPLPLPLGVKGLLGLNFMRHFKVILDFEQGILNFERLSHPR
jgi:hypothetical protein